MDKHDTRHLGHILACETQTLSQFGHFLGWKLVRDLEDDEDDEDGDASSSESLPNMPL